MRNPLSLKKIIYNANHRGTKENDILLGKFANNALEQLTDDEIKLFEDLLEEPDGHIYQWCIGYRHKTVEIPAKYIKFIEKIIKYHESC